MMITVVNQMTKLNISKSFKNIIRSTIIHPERFYSKNNEYSLTSDHNHRISLLYDPTAPDCCKVGHAIGGNWTHLSNEPCVVCGHRNNNNLQNEIIPNHQEILTFLHHYDTDKISFGPNEAQREEIALMKKNKIYKEMPLHDAAISGDVRKINQLCENKNINIDEKDAKFFDQTPISAAAKYGQLESLIELIKKGANSMPTPDKSNGSPYEEATYFQHLSIVEFFQKYVNFLYNFNIDRNSNVECYGCYNWDAHFSESTLDGTMSKYVYCKKCTSQNVIDINEKQANARTQLVDFDLSEMKGVDSLHSILKEIIISGDAHNYWLWLLDIDNFKENADPEILELVGQVLQTMERRIQMPKLIIYPGFPPTRILLGYGGVLKVWRFYLDSGGFALVVECNNQKKYDMQQMYIDLKAEIKKIKFANIVQMNKHIFKEQKPSDLTIKQLKALCRKNNLKVSGNKSQLIARLSNPNESSKSKRTPHITVSIGACHAQGISDYKEIMKRADEAVQTVKNSGGNGIAIDFPWEGKKYTNFRDIPL